MNIDSRPKERHRPSLYIILWTIFMVFVSLVLLHWEWNHYERYERTQLTLEGEKKTNKLDTFLAEIFYEMNQLAQQPNLIESCKKNVQNPLSIEIFNHPRISGMLISDKDKKHWCSTVNFSPDLLPDTNKTSSLSEPINVSFSSQPIRILTLKTDEHIISAFILSSVMDNFFNKHSSSIQQIMLSKKIPKQSLSLNTPIFIPLTNVSDVGLLMIPNYHKIVQKLWGRESIVIFFVLLLYLLGTLHIQQRYRLSLSVTEQLKEAYRQSRFFPLYQPLINAKTEKIIGAEILMRLHSLYDEDISPDIFIPPLEASGMIVDVTLAVMNQSFKECAEFVQKNPDFHFAWNISLAHLVDPHFFERCLALLKYHQISPENIMFELTERSLLEKNEHQLIERLADLRRYGFMLAIDDFGTGHASINYLRHIPFTHLKIDKIYTQAIGTGAITESITTSIIHLAKQLNLQLIAEGIETKEQFEALKKLNVEWMQGWYFSKAITIHQLNQKMLENTYAPTSVTDNLQY